MKLRSCIGTLLLATIATLSQSCRKEQIEPYKLPKESLSELSQAQNRPVPIAKGVATWTKPSHWEEFPPTPLVLGRFRYTGDSDESGSLEITVATLSGATAETVANLNRSRVRLGLAPISEVEIASYAKTIDIHNTPASHIDIPAPASDNPKSPRIVVTILDYLGQKWFVQMGGPTGLVDSQSESYRQFLESIEFSTSSDESTVVANSPKSNNIRFVAPESWVKKNVSVSRIASYAIQKEGSPDADFSIVRYKGDGGGLTPNLNRLRKLIGLGYWTREQTLKRAKPLQSETLEMTLYDLRAETDAEKETVSERIIVAILDSEQHTWHFRLRGAPLIVETERHKLVELLESVTYGSYIDRNLDPEQTAQ